MRITMNEFWMDIKAISLQKCMERISSDFHVSWAAFVKAERVSNEIWVITTNLAT